MTTAWVAGPASGSQISSPPLGPRRIRATWWCSTRRTASRSTDRLTPYRCCSACSEPSDSPTVQPRRTMSASMLRAICEARLSDRAGSGAVLIDGSACEQHAAGDGTAAYGYHRDLRALGHLSLPRLAAQLQASFVQRPVAVHPPGRELAAVRVERQFAVAGDPHGALDEGAGLAVAADAKGLQPRDGEKGEAVVQLGEIEV